MAERDWHEDDVAEDQEVIHQAELPPSWNPAPETVKALQEPAESDSDGDAGKEGEWVDRGIQDVPLENVDLSDTNVSEPADFKKVSYEEITRGIGQLESEVRPAVLQGADGEVFTSLDEQRGVEYHDGGRRVFDAFYGDDAICLNKVGDTYTVVNGYHRLSVARDLGLSTVPARVFELT